MSLRPPEIEISRIDRVEIAVEPWQWEFGGDCAPLCRAPP